MNMKTITAAAMLAACLLHAEGAPDTAKAQVFDDLCSIHVPIGGIATPDFLFNSIVTNGLYGATGTNSNPYAKNKYVERYRSFVDLDQDGMDDLLISDPVSQTARGGLRYRVYLQTNGNYRCVGEIFSHSDAIRVEHVDGFTRQIWTYSPCSGHSGSIGAMRATPHYVAEQTHVFVEIGSDGQEPSTIGFDILETINRKAAVPIRREVSKTEDGKIEWVTIQ